MDRTTTGMIMEEPCGVVDEAEASEAIRMRGISEVVVFQEEEIQDGAVQVSQTGGRHQPDVMNATPQNTSLMRVHIASLGERMLR